jgi:hypothetical protein
MQDNVQRSEWPERSSTPAKTTPDNAQAEEVFRLMQTLLEMTRAATVKAADGDPALLREFLMRRGSILERLVQLSEEEASVPGSLLRQKQFKTNLALMMQTIMAENSRVVQLIRERKKVVLGKIADAQNRRQVLKYTQ